MAKGQSLYDWCMENGEWGQQLLYEFGDGNNSQQFYDEETGMYKSPHDFTKGSHKKIKWICENNHVFIQSPHSRTGVDKIQRRGCPYCSGKKASKENNLLSWCQSNGDFGQQLINEWTGICDDGKHYEITEVLKSSYRNMLWKCPKGHEWYVKICFRTASKTSCPYCFSSMRSEINRKSKTKKGKNDLYTWCISNGDFGQQLINEWTGICDDSCNYELSEIARTSQKKMLWKCYKGHTWYATIANRVSLMQTCPYCSGKKASEENNLYMWCLQNDEYGKQLIDEWTGICDDGNHYEMTEVAKAANKKMLWKCSKGHEWYIKIVDMTSKKLGCPYCSSHRVTDENNLLNWCQSNGDFGQQLINEWTGICDDGMHYEINEVTRDSLNIKGFLSVLGSS